MKDHRQEIRVLTKGSFVIAFLMLALFAGGCASNSVTNPARSATEQLLLSTADDRAMTNVDLSIFANKKIFVDADYFESYDQKYAFGDIRDALSSAGALLVDNITNSDIVVEARAGALSIDYSTSLFGIPNMGVPVPLSGSLQIPELAFYKSEKQNSTTKIALLAYDYRSRKHFYSSGPMVGKSYNYYRKILFFSWVHTDIPEKQKSQKRKDQDSAFFPTPPPPSPAPAQSPGQASPSS
ncbi:MAG TPA: DUF6655 family protein [Verrucomicrobiae bacterium]